MEGLERPSLELIELTDNSRRRNRDILRDIQSTNHLRRELRWCQWVEGAWPGGAVICFIVRECGEGVKE
jgi:hypothetical protein